MLSLKPHKDGDKLQSELRCGDVRTSGTRKRLQPFKERNKTSRDWIEDARYPSARNGMDLFFRGKILTTQEISQRGCSAKGWLLTMHAAVADGTFGPVEA